ncbi:MAG: tRNA lysidine(34) synthetase TilS [Chloroflexi bacterium]|nr:tRNA lysidine(34) synthetase TilS [Chloroflexota bacterium]
MSQNHQHILDDAVVQRNLPSGARILVAVSGGPDSVALLATLHRLSGHPDRRWSLRIGHVNHHLRGPEADEDEAFVRTLGRGWGLEVDVAHVETGDYAAAQHLSPETAARELRLAALLTMLASWPGDVIATGHTKDDQAETLLLRLLRGTGLAGLTAMSSRTPTFARPFLQVRHQEILAALREQQQPFRLDSSNLDPRYRRNRLRADVVPVLEEIQPRAVDLIARTAELLQIDRSYHIRETERAATHLDIAVDQGEISVLTGVWRCLHPALRRHTLRLLVSRLLGHLTDLHETHVAAVEAAVLSATPGTALVGRLPHELAVYLDDRRFALRRGPRPQPGPVGPVHLSGPGAVRLDVGTISAEPVIVDDPAELARLVTVCGPFHALCDAERLGWPLNIRARRPGDRMRPLGAPGSRKVQDIMVDRRIPDRRRDRVPVVEYDGRIIWLAGVALDGRAAIRPETGKALHLRFEPADLTEHGRIWSST